MDLRNEEVLGELFRPSDGVGITELLDASHGVEESLRMEALGREDGTFPFPQLGFFTAEGSLLEFL